MSSAEVALALFFFVPAGMVIWALAIKLWIAVYEDWRSNERRKVDVLERQRKL